MLAFAGLFLTEEHSGWLPALAGKAGSDARVRLLLGDPVVLRNHRGQLLLLRRAGSGLWTIPTGALKKKERITACAIRECREETGLAVELTGLVGVFSDPRRRIAYPDGEVRVPVNVCFYGQPAGGELATDSESDEAAWVAPEDLHGYDIHPAIRRWISHALNGTVPHVDLTAARREDRTGPGCRRGALVFRGCWGRRGIRVVCGARSEGVSAGSRGDRAGNAARSARTRGRCAVRPVCGI